MISQEEKSINGDEKIITRAEKSAPPRRKFEIC
jgi:hypothetical protein